MLQKVQVSIKERSSDSTRLCLLKLELSGFKQKATTTSRAVHKCKERRHFDSSRLHAALHTASLETVGCIRRSGFQDWCGAAQAASLSSGGLVWVRLAASSLLLLFDHIMSHGSNKTGSQSKHVRSWSCRSCFLSGISWDHQRCTQCRRHWSAPPVDSTKQPNKPSNSNKDQHGDKRPPEHNSSAALPSSGSEAHNAAEGARDTINRISDLQNTIGAI